MKESLDKYAGIDFEGMSDDQIMGLLLEDNTELSFFTRGYALMQLFDNRVERKLVKPVMVYGYPKDVSPLAREDRNDPEMAERFEFFVGGIEIGNSYSELQDPIEQRIRFEQQSVMRDVGDEEAHPMDEDFLLAMEYGMPPTGGLGIGIDRLTAVITGANSVRDCITFPTVKKR